MKEAEVEELADGFSGDGDEDEEENDDDDDDDLISLDALDDQSYARLASLCELSETSALTAEQWDAYFREFPDDFVLEGLSGGPSKFGSSTGSPKGSPSHRSPHGKPPSHQCIVNCLGMYMYLVCMGTRV